MKKGIIILCLTVAGAAYAATVYAQQWNREDSLWLLNVLEGKQELQLNEETRKAIEAGKLVVPKWLKDRDKIEVLKDLSSVGAPDSTRLRSIDPYTMPPAVFAMYALYIDKVDSILETSAELLSDAEREALKSYLPPESQNVYIGSNGSAGGVGNLNFNHILSMVFSPSYRQKAHNSKYATAYKNYYDEGAIPAITISERERKQIRQSVRNVKVEFNNNIGSPKRNGIDD